MSRIDLPVQQESLPVHGGRGHGGHSEDVPWPIFESDARYGAWREQCGKGTGAIGLAPRPLRRASPLDWHAQRIESLFKDPPDAVGPLDENCPARHSASQDGEANAASGGNAVRVKVCPELARVFDVQ